MESAELIKKVVDQMKVQNVTQAQLAQLCGLSQAHLSKVLKLKIKLASKTQKKLHLWLGENKPPAGAGAVVRALETKLTSANPRNRMQIMQFLSAVVSFLDAHQGS